MSNVHGNESGIESCFILLECIVEGQRHMSCHNTDLPEVQNPFLDDWLLITRFHIPTHPYTRLIHYCITIASDKFSQHDIVKSQIKILAEDS